MTSPLPKFEPGSSTLNADNSYLVCIICFHETHQTLADLKACLRALRT